MNQLTETLMKTYRPSLAIVVYTNGMDEWHDAYLESHAFNDKGQLLEGKPLKQETIQGLVDVFFDERQNRVQIGGIIPANMIHFDVRPGGYYDMTWFRPAEKRHLFFVDGLHIPSGEAMVPAMLYQVKRKGLYVYALTSDERPALTTELYNAPYHNVSSDGDVCLGSAKVKKPTTRTYQAEMEYWEAMFWKSEFTHLAHAQNPTRTNLNLIWKGLIGTNNAFDNQELLPYMAGKKHLKLANLL
ncbi:hypothetical protein [Paraflavitalea sp. CAU 1676]|uniref:hypothetical protein n=1 Tax=Paraflavitalea sp. CAU 1676 TaxID=3032598 RepID=UPI0023DA42AA|nr:hypothetical protein [Paraflavitalea sp. CAU 1676]MDF2189316.1 hypothetical protein [Paraflavitalea sp. CAU 1676]